MLEEIRVSHDDLDRFCTEVFDQVDAMMAQLIERQRKFEQTATENYRRQVEGLQIQVAETAGQQRLLEQQRAAMEAELTATRRRADELADRLADQKAKMARQQHRWTKEFQRLRNLLEKVTVSLDPATR